MVWTATADASGDPTQAVVTNYADLFPPEWLSRFRPRTLWIEAYRVPYPPDDDTPVPPRSIDLREVCGTFIRSILLYQSVRTPAVDLATPESLPDVEMHPPQMQIPLIMEEWIPRAPSEPSPPGTYPTGGATTHPGGVILVIHNVQVVNHRSNLGTFVVLGTPHHREGHDRIEEISRERLRTAAGLLGAVMGKNAIFEPVFSFEVDAAGNSINVGSVAFENPVWFRKPNLSEGGLALVELFGARISSLAPETRDRTHLSLRWLYQAMSETDGMFSFLKYWIAIETLAMPDGTNIRPVNHRLALAYNQSEAQVRQRFAIGRIFDLRGQIVHHGRTPLIGQDLLGYLEAVYVDLLAQVLAVPSGRLAESALQRSGRTAVELTEAATPVARRRLRVDARGSGGAGVTIVRRGSENPDAQAT